jgi:hypothetical protein
MEFLTKRTENTKGRLRWKPSHPFLFKNRTEAPISRARNFIDGMPIPFFLGSFLGRPFPKSSTVRTPMFAFFSSLVLIPGENGENGKKAGDEAGQKGVTLHR